MGKRLITLDTSGLFALLNRGDGDHERVKTALFEDRGPYQVPAGILSEISYMVEERLRPEAFESFLLDLEAGDLTLECGEEDLPRIRVLVER